MPAYDFECNNCGCREEIICSAKEIRHKEKSVKCKICGTTMLRIFNFNTGSHGDYTHVSESLAIAPSQIKEHREKFPNVDVFSDGRLRFNTYRDHDSYLKKTGFFKHTQKIKRKKP